MTTQTVGARRAALVAGLGLALAISTSALAGGEKPGTAKGGATKPAAVKAAASFSDLTSTFDKQVEDSEKAIRKARYEAIVVYVKANGSAKDAEEARKALVDLAEEMEEWAKVVQHSDEFLVAHAGSKSKAEVMFSRVGGLVGLEKNDDAKAAYEALTKALKMDVDGPRMMWSVWSGYAGFLADLGDIDAAKAAYASAKAAIPHPEVAQLADEALRSLDAIGDEPTAFPDGAKDMEGKALSLKDFAGKVLLIDFWATWCGPCRAEIPNVVAAFEKFHAKGFEVVGITLDKEGKAFTASNKMAWRQFYDGGYWQNEIATLYQVHGIPHTILLGKDGKIARTGVRGKALERAVAKLLTAEASKPAPAPKKE